MLPQRLGVIGAGAWGTALAVAARRAGRDVVLWARRPEQAAAIAASRENARYLPGIALDPAIKVTAEARDLATSDALLLVVPSQHLRALAAELEAVLPRVPLVLCAKGIELASGKLLDQVVDEALPGRPVAVLSGPTFAAEVAKGLPAAVTLAASQADLGQALAEALGSAAFRPYWSDDVTGVLIGGAVKNVIAIAAGMVAGHGYGENARAALITRGLAEIGRLAEALGGRRETLMGLSGLGDLVLTCGSTQSRNFSLGQRIGEGKTLAEATGASRGVAEGVATATAVLALGQRLEVELPIAAAVDAVLHGGASLDHAVGALLARPLKSESL